MFVLNRFFFFSTTFHFIRLLLWICRVPFNLRFSWTYWSTMYCLFWVKSWLWLHTNNTNPTSEEDVFNSFSSKNVALSHSSHKLMAFVKKLIIIVWNLLYSLLIVRFFCDFLSVICNEKLFITEFHRKMLIKIFTNDDEYEEEIWIYLMIKILEKLDEHNIWWFAWF